MGMIEFYQSWQQCLQHLARVLPDCRTLVLGPLPSDKEVVSTIARQIVELLGKKVFPSHVEADLISLRELLINLDDIPAQLEHQDSLVQAKKVLRRLQSDGGAQVISSTHLTPSEDFPIKSERTVSLTPQKDLWNIPIRFAKGVGPSRAGLLEKVGVLTIEDAFWFLPWRYEDWSIITPIDRLQPDNLSTVDGVVLSCVLKRTSRKGLVIVTVTIEDSTGRLEGVFFNQPFLEQVFVKGRQVLFRGMVSEGRTEFAPLQMRGPQHEMISGNLNSFDEKQRVIPVYHETKGLTTRQFRRILTGLHQQHGHAVKEVLPHSLLEELHLPAIQTAIADLHFPEQANQLVQLNQGATSAHRRLAFEELLLLQLALAVRRRHVKTESDGIAFSVNHPLVIQLQKILPFQLTPAQLRVIREIDHDMAQSLVMNRLIQGDVGSGKTMVAFHAMLVACSSGYQAVLMAPTEVFE